MKGKWKVEKRYQMGFQLAFTFRSSDFFTAEYSSKKSLDPPQLMSLPRRSIQLPLKAVLKSMSNDIKNPTRGTKMGATMLLVTGSILTYVFVLKIFARIWDPNAYLQHEFVAFVAGLLLWFGVRMWSQWRLPLGIIWLLFGVLAFFNSTQYRSPNDFPNVPGFRTGPEALRALSHASIVMGCVALSLGASLLCWQRFMHRLTKPQMTPPSPV